ncbi:hypothetical protein Riv7116_5561 [Rivularia sp. PCC 7116]|uniref:hypothetical protein n=1 Tax=Rivularia sp. PCC 7116 TaxID=373994 RepID=UPI00029F1FA7|nr:hypothetical protein [Rivularia sp. PCC 7116]AFY57930.1 hypothetical protein Riv7116_5561 [Rivularia sp. PCC 7116]
MSQTASKHLVIPEPSEELIVSEPWTMDNYADGLMDELFSDIDCILDGKAHLSKQIVQPQQQLILHQATPPQVVAPPTIVSPFQETEQRRIEAEFNRVVRGDSPKTAKTVKKSRRKIWRNLGQILKVGAGLGLAIAAINWAISNGLLNRLTSQSLQFALQEPALKQKVIEAQSAPTQAEIKSELVDYMLSALEVIDSQKGRQDRASANNIARATPVPANQATLAYANQPPANLPPPRIANNAKPLPSRNTRVVERIYIPVYQAPQPMRYAPPEIAQAPTPTPLPPIKTASKGVAPKPSDTKAKKPAPVKVAKANTPKNIQAFASIREIKPLAVKNKPVNVKQAPEIPKMKQTATVAPSTPEKAAPVPKPVASKEQKVASVPTSSHVLEGLLELGEQSAALFKVNGVSRRVQKGETIGASGWTLVDVANGEAIIRRNGEVRSIFAGQKF